MNLRETVEYKAMTPYEATGYAEGFEEAESETQILAAWQYLHDTRIGYQLQGHFGRTITDLIEEGHIEA